MLIGEMCHFVDLMQFICAEQPVSVYAQALSLKSQKSSDHDNLTIVISFDGGSVGTLSYNTVGSSRFPKERIEVFGSGRVAVMDDFRALEILKNDKPTRIKSSNQDKGQEREIAETIKSFRTRGAAPIPFSELAAGMRIIFAARQSAMSGQAIDVISVAPVAMAVAPLIG